ncbi:isoprenylcysteine carboxylmethyltransferase family protein [Rhizobium sp. TRM95111]|uniref:methyltransferase family protein n=1 Tax=Rhizobium alarense TaxID=2846851 RepID=UPI001F2751CE|nr:isoprenylcysteine carboxylmethyltransferase family protein [Rhizobium alarense]MCF3639412.1 isoprenylcysteine carboxylmethyltransferase family protein [Rhizobium alarense]
MTIVSLMVVGFYTWSLKGHFSSPTMPDGAKVISAAVTASTLFFLYLIWSREQSGTAQGIGLLLEIAAAVLFWWAVSASRRARLRFAFDADHPDSIVTEGPYRYVRHPFYSSYIVFWSGWALATQTIWAIVPVVAFVAIYIVAARDEERKFGNTALAPTYADYKSRTGFLFPRLTRG